MLEEINSLRSKYLKTQQDLRLLRTDTEAQAQQHQLEYHSLLMDIIEELDALESEEKKEKLKQHSDIDRIEKYLKPTKKILRELLKKHGVEKFKLPFLQFSQNTDFAEIVSVVPNQSLEKGTLVSIEKEAYRQGDLMFRSAQIIVVG